MYTREEIASWYSITVRTLTQMLRDAGIMTGDSKKTRITPKQLQAIFEEFGRPQKIPKGIQIPLF